jgi:hypothetical protein
LFGYLARVALVTQSDLDHFASNDLTNGIVAIDEAQAFEHGTLDRGQIDQITCAAVADKMLARLSATVAQSGIAPSKMLPRFETEH